MRFLNAKYPILFVVLLRTNDNNIILLSSPWKLSTAVIRTLRRFGYFLRSYNLKTLSLKKFRQILFEELKKKMGFSLVQIEKFGHCMWLKLWSLLLCSPAQWDSYTMPQYIVIRKHFSWWFRQCPLSKINKHIIQYYYVITVVSHRQCDCWSYLLQIRVRYDR